MLATITSNRTWRPSLNDTRVLAFAVGSIWLKNFLRSGASGQCFETFSYCAHTESGYIAGYSV